MTPSNHTGSGRPARVFALIDCNNFFVSCERLFRPELEGKPVVVLSSNDGCAISRSNEAKNLGVPMGAPVFKYRQLFEQHSIVRFSANFELYGDISRRIIQILTTVTPRNEVYSVDESFLDLSQLPIEDYEAWGKVVRQRILEWVGIPVSIGIAPSKTLAKLANERAKKLERLGGVLSLAGLPEKLQRPYLESVPVETVWGVGWRLAPRLRAEGIGTAWQLRQLHPRRAQQLMGIHGRQMVAELNGMSCLPLTQEERLPKSIAATRTFGEDTSDPYTLEAALATFVSSAAFKLRRSGQVTRRAALFLTTNKHKPGYQRWGSEVVFRTPTADTGFIASVLKSELRRLYNPAASYHRAGVLLHDFLPETYLQADLLGEVDINLHLKSLRRMQAVDTINRRFGRGHAVYASEKLGSRWQPKRRSRSPRYTTQWNELPWCKIR